MPLKSALKIAISVTMLVVVFQYVEPNQLIATLASIPAWTALLVVLGYLTGQVLSAYKWLLIARSGGINVSYPTALKAYFIGMFVNCFGLGIVGGDVTRGVLLSSGKPRKTQAIASVVADRAHGLAVLALLGTVATLLFGQSAIDSGFVFLLFFIGLAITLGWFVGPAILLRIVQPENKLREKVVQLSEVFPKRLTTVLFLSLISLLFHLLQIGLHWIMGIGLGVNLSWTFLLVVVPFVNILSSLPISWNGLGVRESAYIFFFCGQAAVLRDEEAIALGALWLLAVTVSSAIGGMVAFLGGDFSTIFAAAKHAPNQAGSPHAPDQRANERPTSVQPAP